MENPLGMFKVLPDHFYLNLAYYLKFQTAIYGYFNQKLYRKFDQDTVSKKYTGHDVFRVVFSRRNFVVISGL